MMKFNISYLNFCDDKSGFKLDGLKPLEKRRLGRAAKAIFTLLDGVDFSSKNIAFIFASNHGEVSRCISLLAELSLNNFVSPTSFSLSVLNSSLATYAIMKKLNSPIFAIGSKQTVRDGLISAYCKLDEYDEVCVICYDEILYSDEFSAVAFIVTKGDNISLTPSNLENLTMEDLKCYKL